MESNKSSSSSSSWGVTISETFKFKGKGVTMAILFLAISALFITAVIYKCFRSRPNDAEVGIELAAQNSDVLPPGCDQQQT